ncbi:hypothetical protein LCM23_06245 [Cytobacillus kochii]|uniref:hypothetical protein n=1 Tax=Cytobacillus kochii TaxID=859143 RepID=UPI001CD70BA2|nr:hypothetical protein [Cytobacillus kochii]MCA1025685.1 hypothetical protein [Cytobacillus kochii]
MPKVTNLHEEELECTNCYLVNEYFHRVKDSTTQDELKNHLFNLVSETKDIAVVEYLLEEVNKKVSYSDDCEGICEDFCDKCCSDTLHDL